MHIPDHFHESDPSKLQGLIDAHPLATLVVANDGAIEINHLPLLLHTRADGVQVLRGHVARANLVWQQLPNASEVLALFHGPAAYVSPSWYPSKSTHGKVVPTWNYSVVHVTGTARAISDPTWLLQHVTSLTDSLESKQPSPWRVSDAPPEYVNVMLAQIVGIELRIDSMRGKWKQSQNRSTADRRGVAAGLCAQGTEASQTVAAAIGEANPEP